MNNVIYIKHFENGKKYVGLTNNFKKRMYQHDRTAKNGECSHLPIYKAMLKYHHYTEIVFKSESYEDVLKYEKIIIQNFKDLGIELYNLTDGGEGVCGFKFSEEDKNKRKGKNNPKSHPLEYYETYPVERSDFKKICKRQGWEFEKFKEVYALSVRRPVGRKVKKYYYFYKGEELL